MKNLNLIDLSEQNLAIVSMEGTLFKQKIKLFHFPKIMKEQFHKLSNKKIMMIRMS